MKAFKLLLILFAAQISWSSPGFHGITQESSPSSIQGAGRTSDGELSLKISTSWEEFSPLYFSLPLLEGLFSEKFNGLPQESQALQNEEKGTNRIILTPVRAGTREPILTEDTLDTLIRDYGK